MDKKDKARRRYESGWKYKDISNEFDIPMNTLKSWKKRYKWQRGGAPSEVQPKTRGAPLNNKNAVGNKGGAKPKNKHAVATGEFETIIKDFMTDEEKDYYQNIGTDPFFVLQDEIRMLRFRQTRMLKRIQVAEAGLNDKEIQTLKELRGRKKVIESKGRRVSVEVEPDLLITETREKTTRKIDDILRIEDALTRVSNQLTRSIKQLNELTMSETKLDLMTVQIDKTKAEIEVLRGSKEGNEDATDWKEMLDEIEAELGDANE